MSRRILALQTSGPREGVAASVGEEILSCQDLVGPGRSARTLVPTIQQVLAEVGWKMSDVNLIAVAAGPGSFTGLRVGVTTAKVLAYATRADVLGINTLDVIAQQVPQEINSALAAIDAQRGGLYVGRFRRDDAGVMRMIGETQLVPRQDWLDGLEGGTWVAGTGLAKIAQQLPGGVNADDQEAWQPRADTLARLAWILDGEGATDDPWRLVPQYHRRSAAEEKANSKPSTAGN